MKNLVSIAFLTLALCGCASDSEPVVQAAPQPEATHPSPALMTEPSGAEMLTLFASVAAPGQTVDLEADPNGRSPGLGTLKERFISARGQSCARMVFTPNRPAFHWSDFELVFCDGPSGWTLAQPLQHIDLVRISRGSFLGFKQAGIISSYAR